MAKTEQQIAIEERVRQRMSSGAAQAATPPAASSGSGYTSETLPRAIIAPQERYTASGAMGNIGPSAAAYGGQFVDLASAVAEDPRILKEAVKMLFTGEALSELKDYYSNTYGSVDKALRKAYSDPVMFMSDISLAGAPLKIMSKLGGLASSKAGFKAGESVMSGASRVGGAIEGADPVSAATSLALGGASNLPGVRNFPEETYETNLKMGTSPTSKYSDPKVRSRVINTLLEEQIPISASGLEKLQKIVASRTKDLDSLINIAEKEGKTIPISEILRPLKQLRDEISDPITNPLASSQSALIEDYAMNWIQSLGPVTEITPSQARTLRQNLDRQLRFDKIDTVTPPIQRQITEEVASGAREALRETVEGYGTTGMDISRLLEAETPLRRAQSRMGQNNALGLRQTIGMGAGAGVGASGEAFNQILGVLIAGGAAIMTPQNKERLARLVYRNRDLTADQKRTLLGYITTQSAPTAQRLEEAEVKQ